MTIGSIGPGKISLARELARASLAVNLSDFDAEIIAKAKICLLDFLSCAFEARNHAWSRQAIGIARGIENGATIIGTDKLSMPGDAAFANATRRRNGSCDPHHDQQWQTRNRGCIDQTEDDDTARQFVARELQSSAR